MSDETVSIVRMDSSDADEVASRAIAFLLRENVIIPNPKRDSLMQPSQWVAGPAAESAMRRPVQPASWRELADTGVEVDLDRQLHHAMENYEPPACPRCDVTLDEPGHHDLLFAWQDSGQEPTVACSACGSPSRLGDWRSEWPSTVGSPAIVFRNWPPLTTSFLHQLRLVLGGRTEVIRAHF